MTSEAEHRPQERHEAPEITATAIRCAQCQTRFATREKATEHFQQTGHTVTWLVASRVTIARRPLTRRRRPVRIFDDAPGGVT